MTEVVRHILSSVVLLGNGILAGVLFAVAISVIPAADALPVDRYIQLHQLLGRHYDPIMPIIAGSAILSDLILAAWLAPTTPTRILCGIGFLSLLGVSVVSQTRNVPINERVRAVGDAAVPADWPDPRPQWRSWHQLRTSFAILALVVNAIAVSWMT
jgi:uncharacterized membrane protein